MIQPQLVAKGVATREDKFRNNPELDRKRRELRSIICKRTQDKIAGDPELARIREERNILSGAKGGLKGAKVQHSQRWKCTVTGYISTPCGLSHHQKRRGIDTSNRVKIP